MSATTGGTGSGDADGDGVADAVDVCPDLDDLGDDDGDGVLARLDICLNGDDDLDTDRDGVPDACDRCTGADASGDSDEDGMCDLPISGGGYACATQLFSSAGYCMWDCDIDASVAIATSIDPDDDTCGLLGTRPDPGCCYTCVNDCVQMPATVPVVDCTREVKTCQTILRDQPDAEDGDYPIDPDGEGGSPAFAAYCDMTRDGGGWTLVAKVNPADALDVSEPRGFLALSRNREQLLDAEGRVNQASASYGFATIRNLVTDDQTVARFELVNGADYQETLPFFKVVRSENLRQWFSGDEATATPTCIDPALSDECTTNAFAVLSEAGGARYSLEGMDLNKHGLPAVEALAMRLEGDLDAAQSGVYSGNPDWGGYNTSWGNGLLIWLRDRTE